MKKITSIIITIMLSSCGNSSKTTNEMETILNCIGRKVVINKDTLVIQDVTNFGHDFELSNRTTIRVVDSAIFKIQ